jgi:DNA-binding Lrp family transcriptional regulator
MARIKLDRTDRLLLRDLQADGRITNVELASRASLSAPPCLRRVRRLEQAGFIHGYHANLNAEALGFAETAYIQVGLERQAESDLNAFEQLTLGWPEVRETYMLEGVNDFLLKVVTKDQRHYRRFLSTLTGSPNVIHVKTMRVVRRAKHDVGIPIELDATA